MIVELIENGQRASEISHEYGLNEAMIRRWKKELNNTAKSSFTSHGKVSLTTEEKEITRMNYPEAEHRGIP